MLGQAKSRSRKPMKLVTIALYVATSPFTICAGAALAALALATAAGNYLTNPQSVVAVASPPVRQIISVPEASSQSITGIPAPSGSAQANIPSITTAPPSPGLQPFTSNEPTTVPASTQQIRSSTSLTQDPLFWSYGAIVMGCVTGCLMISRQLSTAKTGGSKKTMSSRSKVFVPLPLDQVPVSGYRQQPALGYASAPVAALPVASRYATSPTVRQPAGTTSRKQHQPMRASNSERARLTAAPQVAPQVTVLPQTAVHPLDWNDPGLASQLDVRKSRPLSSWQ